MANTPKAYSTINTVLKAGAENNLTKLCVIKSYPDLGKLA